MTRSTFGLVDCGQYNVTGNSTRSICLSTSRPCHNTDLTVTLNQQTKQIRTCFHSPLTRINPFYYLSVCLKTLGEQQTGNILIKCHRMQHLIWDYTVSSSLSAKVHLFISLSLGSNQKPCLISLFDQKILFGCSLN